MISSKIMTFPPYLEESVKVIGPLSTARRQIYDTSHLISKMILIMSDYHLLLLIRWVTLPSYQMQVILSQEVLLIKTLSVKTAFGDNHQE